MEGFGGLEAGLKRPMRKNTQNKEGITVKLKLENNKKKKKKERNRNYFLEVGPTKEKAKTEIC